VCSSGAQFYQQLSSTKHPPALIFFLEKNMYSFFLLVSNHMLCGLGLLGRIEPARKACSPLGVSGDVKNRGCPSHFPDNELRKVAEWVWGVVTVTYYIGNLM
jgi:hypothetical protein